MAKVLACPSCGHKHPLEDIAGVESFACEDCGKVLAVPEQARIIAKKVSVPASTNAPVSESQPEVVPEPLSIPPLSYDNVDESEPDGDDIVIVARSSMNHMDVAPASASQPSSDSTSVHDALAPSVVGTSGKPTTDAPSKQPVPNSAASPSHHKKLHVPLGWIGALLAWVIGVPAGFFIVVILPRVFGYGFHASDFVDIITTQGIGRYKILVGLILMWSIASVICVTALSYLLKMFVRARKAAV